MWRRDSPCPATNDRTPNLSETTPKCSGTSPPVQLPFSLPGHGNFVSSTLTLWTRPSGAPSHHTRLLIIQQYNTNLTTVRISNLQILATQNKSFGFSLGIPIAMVEVQTQPPTPVAGAKTVGARAAIAIPPTSITAPSSSIAPPTRPPLVAFSPVNQNGSFEFDRVIKSGYVQKRTQTTKVETFRVMGFPEA